MRALTTYGRLLRTVVSLKGTAADLRLLALHQRDPKAKGQLDEAAAELERMVDRLDRRRRDILAQEPSYDELGVEPQKPVVSKN